MAFGINPEDIARSIRFGLDNIVVGLNGAPKRDIPLELGTGPGKPPTDWMGGFKQMLQPARPFNPWPSPNMPGATPKADPWTPKAKPFASAPGQGPYSFPVAGYTGKDVPLHWGTDSGGTDLFAAAGTPVEAMRGGKVISAGADPIGGNTVLIQGDDGNQYYYAHLDKAPSVKAGQIVGLGDYLGGVGDTGNAKGTGAHLHFGMGPSITSGIGAQGGVGAGFDAVGLLKSVLAGSAPINLAQVNRGDSPQDPGDIEAKKAQALGLAESMFGPEGARVLNATFSAENGWSGLVGDLNRDPAGSHGPLQFYGGGGQLNVFAKDHGMSVVDAGAYVRDNPVEAVKWALNGYYGQALRAGMDQGYRGAELAEYVQMNGQRSDKKLTAGKARAAYKGLYGG